MRNMKIRVIKIEELATNCQEAYGRISKIMVKTTWSPLVLGKTPKMIGILLWCLLIFNICREAEGIPTSFNYNETNEHYRTEDELVDGYLVWNPKCHMLRKEPMDPAIKKFFKKQKFVPCSKGPLLSSIRKEKNGSSTLLINKKVAGKYKKLSCSWTPINRMVPKNPPSGDWDTKIETGSSHYFKNQVMLPSDVEIVMVSCKQEQGAKKKKSIEVYKNIHPIFNPAKVRKRLKIAGSKSNPAQQRKISVLILGLDSVSRSNFQRSLPNTARYLHKNGWHDLKGYNKMADNTFPNLMAFLTGQDSKTVYSECHPQKAYGLDKCSFLWRNFRNAGYATAYGEDVVDSATFNFMKAGFVDPPTDYYLRPYIIASEKFLTVTKHFDAKYCTGPELTADRIFNSAFDFAKTFLGSPYFGLFWTNTVSHDDYTAPSSMDDHFLDMFQHFEKEGITNDTVMVFLSDHGTRYGDIRESFVGWYEERLPFIYIKFPSWMKESVGISRALRINEHRLTSPYDLYETFRDILMKSGGNADPSSGCPTCQSLLKPVPIERGCEDAGISPHWCTCSDFETASTSDKIAQEGAARFLEYAEDNIKNYKNGKKDRLCEKLSVGKILEAKKIISRDRKIAGGSSVEKYSYFLETSPGGAKFEYTLRVHGDGNYTISPDEISRLNSYFKSAKCLANGPKMFCHCRK